MFYLKKVFSSCAFLICIHLATPAWAGSYDDFFRAIVQDDAATVQALLQRGFDPNTLNPQGVGALVLAIQGDSRTTLGLLLKQPSIQVELRNPNDESPLMLAALNGDLALCQQLIAQGADVNKPGWTPLHYAATKGHVAVIGLLLDAHAYIDAASPNNTTPLMMAARYGSDSAVKWLLESGADPLLKNDQGLSALDFANHDKRTDAATIIKAFIRGRSQH